MQIGVNNDNLPPTKKSGCAGAAALMATEKPSGVIKLLGIEAYALFRVVSALAN